MLTIDEELFREPTQVMSDIISPHTLTFLLARSGFRALDASSTFIGEKTDPVEKRRLILGIFRSLIVSISAVRKTGSELDFNAATLATDFTTKNLSKYASKPDARELYLAANLAALASSSLHSNRPELLIGEMESFARELQNETLLDEYELDKSGFDPSKDFQRFPRIWRTTLRRTSEPSAVMLDIADRPEFSFWRKWYISVLDGAQLNADLEREVSTIASADWDKGPEHIAEVISQLQVRQNLEKLSLPEEMFLNERTGKLFVVPKQHPRSEIYENSLSRVREAIETYLPERSNALSRDSFAVRLIARALDKYAGNPYRVHQDFLIAGDTIKREIAIGDLPVGDTGILFLLSALDEAASDIRAAMPEVQEAVAARAKLRFEEANDDEKQSFLRAAEMLEAISSRELALEISEDSEQILETQETALSTSALYRLASRMSKSFKVLEKVNADTKLAAVGAAIAGLSAAVLSLLFGV